MATHNHLRTVCATLLLLGSLNNGRHAQQWSGAQNPTGNIWRPGKRRPRFRTGGGRRQEAPS